MEKNILLEDITRINNVFNYLGNSTINEEESYNNLLFESLLIEQPNPIENAIRAFEHNPYFERELDRLSPAGTGSVVDRFLTHLNTLSGQQRRRILLDLSNFSEPFANLYVQNSIEAFDRLRGMYRGSERGFYKRLENEFGPNVRKAYERLRPRKARLIPGIRQRGRQAAAAEQPKNLSKWETFWVTPNVLHEKITAIIDLHIKEFTNTFIKTRDEVIDDMFAKFNYARERYRLGGVPVGAHEELFVDVANNLQSLRDDKKNYLDWDLVYREIRSALVGGGRYTNEEAAEIIRALKDNNPWKTNHFESTKNSKLSRFWDETSMQRSFSEIMSAKGFKAKARAWGKRWTSIPFSEFAIGTVKTDKEFAYYYDKYGAFGGSFKLWMVLTAATKVGIPLLAAVFKTTIQSIINLFPGSGLYNPNLEEGTWGIFKEFLYDYYESLFNFSGSLGQKVWSTIRILIPFDSLYARWFVDTVQTVREANYGKIDFSSSVVELIRRVLGFAKQKSKEAREYIETQENRFQAKYENTLAGFGLFLNAQNPKLEPYKGWTHPNEYWITEKNSETGLPFGIDSNGKKYIFNSNPDVMSFEECKDCVVKSTSLTDYDGEDSQDQSQQSTQNQQPVQPIIPIEKSTDEKWIEFRKNKKIGDGYRHKLPDGTTVYVDANNDQYYFDGTTFIKY